MRYRYTSILLALLLGSGLLVAAQPEAEDDLPATAELKQQVNLPTLIRLGLQQSPRIKAARAKWQAAIEKIPQAEALPDPRVMFDYFGESVETRVGPQEYRYGLSQSFPWPGTLNQAGEVAAREVRIKHADYEQAIRDLIVDLKMSYNELLYLRGAIEITRQNQELLNHILKVANTEYAEGKAKFNDVLKAQSQIAQLGYDMILLRELEQVEIAKLNALLDLPTDFPLGEAEMPPVHLVKADIATLTIIALETRQELEAARGRVDKAEEAIRFAKMQNRPKFTVNAMQIATGESDMNVDESGKDPWLVGIGISIPLWFDRNRSRVREAELMRDAAIHATEALENQTGSDVKSAYFRLENARRLITLYDKTLIPQAKQAMEIAEQ